MTPLRLSISCLAMLLALFTVGCGGGGGGGSAAPADESLIAGSYHLLVFGAEDGALDAADSAWGALSADGLGAFTGTGASNTGSSVASPIDLTSSYSVAATRETTYLISSEGFAGWTNTSGSAALLGSVLAGREPLMLTLLKLGSGFSNASLNGAYRMAGYSVNLAGDAITFFGTATFDGLGGAAFGVSENDEGSVTTVIGTLPASYAVQADGQVTITLPSGDTVAGAIQADGGIVLAAGSTTNGETPQFFAFVPSGAAMTDATLSGSYQLIGLERDGGGFTSLTGTVVANGSGSLSASFTRNADGTITTSGPDIVDYSVAADGMLTTDATGDALLGGVSPSGAFAILGGPAAPGSNPKLFVLMRR